MHLKLLIIYAFFQMFMANAHAIDYDNNGNPHPHGIVSSHSGTKVQLKNDTYTISSDTVSGKNQFFSFDQLNVHSGEHAIFNDQNMNHSIARVTGNNYSWINGQLTSHAQNLYVMNPNGVLIGDQAKLNVSGSLYVTSADYIEFQDGGKYHADLNQPDLLTSAPPSAFGFISTKNSGEIKCDKTTIDMPENKDIAIIGRSVALKNTQIKTTGGNVHIAAINHSEKVDMNEKAVSNATISDAEISVTEKSSITVKNSAQSAGDIWIYGGKFYCNNSNINVQTNGALTGKLNINMAKKIELDNQSNITSSTSGVAKSAIIKLKSQNINITGQSAIVSESLAEGKSGDILLEAGSSVYISDRNNDVSSGLVNYALKADTGNIQIISPVTTIKESEIYIIGDGEGHGGNIFITGDEINILNGTYMRNVSYGSGSSGNIMLKTNNKAVFSGKYHNEYNQIAVESHDSGDTGTVDIHSTDIYIEDATIGNNVFFSNDNAGDIDIHADQTLSMKNATVTAEAFFSGNSGNINLYADNLIMDGGFVSTSVAKGERAGNISFTGNHFYIKEASNINASSSGTGQAGQILMNAFHDIHLSGNIYNYTSGPGKANTIEINTPELLIDKTARIYSRSVQLGAIEEPSGPAGKIFIHTDQCLIRDKAKISTETSSDSDGGDIYINATQQIDINGYNHYDQPMGLFSISQHKIYPDKQGNAGNIQVNTPMLKMTGPCASIQSGTFTSGKGGNVFIKVNHLELADRASISTQSTIAQNAGDAGNVCIDAKNRIRLKDRSQITTSAQNAGGGRININLQDFLYLENSTINSSVMNGSENGGNIAISYPELMAMNHSDIVARAYEGYGGNIFISGKNIILSSDSTIDASSTRGIDGVVALKGLEQSSINQIHALADNFLNAEKWSKTPCIQRTGTIEDRLVMKTRDSTPVLPGDWQSTPPIPIMHFDFMNNPLLIEAEQLFQQGHFTRAIDQWMARISEIPLEYQPIIQSRIAYAYKQSGFYKKTFSILNLENEDSLYQRLCVNRLADIYLYTGQHKKALKTIELALGHFDQFPENESIRAGILNHQGMIHAVSGEYDLASRSFQNALDLIYYSGKNEYDSLTATIYLNQARLKLFYTEEFDWNWLSDLYQYLIQAPDNRLSVFHLLEFCVIAEAFQQKHESFVFNKWIDQTLLTAFQMTSTQHNKRLLSLVCGLMGKRLAMDKNQQQAIHWLNQAIFWASSGNFPELEYQWQKQIADCYAKQKQIQRSIRHYDQALSILQPIIQEFDTGYRNNSDRFRTFIRPLYTDYTNILLKTTTTKLDQQAFEKTIIQAIQLVEGLKYREINNYFKDECMTIDAQQYSVPIRSPKNTAILYYIQHPDSLSLIVILPSEITMKTIPINASQLHELVKRLSHQLQNPSTTDFLTYSTTLYDHLIMPVQDDLNFDQINTLIVVPDGTLKNLAFSTIFDGNSYLIEKYQIACLMALTRTNCFDRDRPVIDKVLACGLSVSVSDYPPLDHVENEIHKIEQIFPCDPLINQSFTESNLTRLISQRYYPVIHLATHANFGNTSDHTFLLAYDNNISMKQLDTIMRINRYRKKPVELLTLSACRTAVGDERSILGLSGIALMAGVKSVLATLWFVNDPATASIIPEFYRHLSDPEISKAKALQMTQISCIRSDQFDHPYYWGPFVLFGNW